MAMRVRRSFEMVHERDEEAGDEAGEGEQDRPHREAGEGQPDEGPVPVPVEAAVQHLEHPAKANREDCAMNSGKVCEQG